MKLFAHKVTRIALDFGHELSRTTGLAWSHDGDVRKVFGFEAGKFSELLAAKKTVAGGYADVEIKVGESVTRKFDMNPHGFI